MTVELASDVEDFVRTQVRSGGCANAEALINDVIRSIRDQQTTTFNITPELEAWLLKAAEAPTTPLTKGDFDAIRKRVKGRSTLEGNAGS